MLNTLLHLLALPLAIQAPAQVAAEPSPPNILLLLADDQRADTIAAWGNPHIRTPHIDALAARGTSLHRTYCLGSPHGAVCVPSRAMIHTGRSYHRIDLGDFEGCVTLGEALRAGGYNTFHTGKWHNGRGAFARSFEGGEAVLLGGMSSHVDVPVQDFVDGEFGDRRQEATHSSELFADAAVKFLLDASDDRPFFLSVAFTAPHDPRDPPRNWARPFYDDPPPLPANFLPEHPFDNGMLVLRDEVLGAWPRTPALVREQLAEYYGLIEHLDHQVGRVLDALRRRGALDNTIVVYTADHGLAVGSHGLLGKQSVYEHSLRSPMIFAGPGVPEDGHVTALTYLNDLYPTLLRMAGVQGDTSDELIGKDLAPVLEGRTDTHHPSVFLSIKNSQRAISDGRWKLIRYPLVDHTQLFDLASDPHERIDLARRPEHAERVAALMRDLHAWQVRAGDKAPLEVENPKPMAFDFSQVERKVDRWQPRWIREKYFEEK